MNGVRVEAIGRGYWSPNLIPNRVGLPIFAEMMAKRVRYVINRVIDLRRVP